MRLSIIFFVAGITLGISFASVAKSDPCPAHEAAFVEENLQQVETWAQFSVFYSQHKQCDVDALRYAFTQQVAHLAGNDKGLLGLSKVLAKRPRLKPIILKHLHSEAVSSNDRDQILKAIDACQASQKNLCRDVKKMLGP